MSEFITDLSLIWKQGANNLLWCKGRWKLCYRATSTYTDRTFNHKSVPNLCTQLMIASSEWHLAVRFIYTYWRVSAGPHLKSSGNSSEAWGIRMSRNRNQCLCSMKGALPIKRSWDYCWWHISRVNRRRVSSLGQLSHLIKSCVRAAHNTLLSLMMWWWFTLDFALWEVNTLLM